MRFIGFERQGQLCGAHEEKTSTSFALQKGGMHRKVRFIEWMPFSGNAYDAKRLVPYAEMRASLPPWCRSRRTALMIRPNGGPLVSPRGLHHVHVRALLRELQSRARHGRRSLKACLFGSDSVSLRDACGAACGPGARRFDPGRPPEKALKHGGHDNVGRGAGGFENRPMVKIGG